MSRITFPEPTQFESLGRNGYMATLGVLVTDMTDTSGCVLLEPINSRGDVGRARVVVHARALPDLIAQLQAIAQSSAFGDAYEDVMASVKR